MKILMIQTHADPSGTHIAGKTYIVDDKLGNSLVNARAAVNLDLPSPEPPAEEKNPDHVDLTQIKGISEKVAEALVKDGFDSYEIIAASTVEDLKEIIQKAGLARNARDIDTWADQAKALVVED